MVTFTIPKKLVGKDDLVVVPKKEFDALVARADNPVREADVLRWSREAKQLRRGGKLAKFV